EPFVTYGRLGDELQYQLGIRRIFPTHVGHVAGAMMKKIQNIDPRAPLINALITRGDGLPGGGVGAFFAEKYAKPRYEKWTSLPKTTRLELVKRERDSILRYPLWKTIYTQLFGVPITVLRPRQGTEVDGKSNGTCAESPEHRKLKEWVARNPQRIGLPTQFGK